MGNQDNFKEFDFEGGDDSGADVKGEEIWN